jgi:protocatechuate 3,4-dioxygenase beta subunit
MVSAFSIDETKPDWALAYKFDIVLRGPESTPFEEAH